MGVHPLDINQHVLREINQQYQGIHKGKGTMSWNDSPHLPQEYSELKRLGRRLRQGYVVLGPETSGSSLCRKGMYVLGAERA